MVHTSGAQPANPLFDKLDFGPHEVGYQLIKAYDLARSPLLEQLTLPEDQHKGRAVPIYFWYPADNEKTTPDMTFREYLNGWAYSWDFELKSEDVAEEAVKQFSDYYYGRSETTINSYFDLEIETRAQKDATPSSGKFPLVVFSHGHMDRWWIWGELLASHGIAVVGTPNTGTFQKRHEMGLSGLESQIRDAEFAISEMARFDFVDTRAVVTAGNSYGALTATGVATRNRNVKGVVSLDGIIADQNEGELLLRTPFWDYQQFTTPILHTNSAFRYSSNYIWMDRMKYADQYRVTFTNLRHEDYHFQGMADLFGMSFSGANEMTDHSTDFAWLTTYVLNFVKGVTGSPQHLEYIKRNPEENGITDGAVTSKFTQGFKDTYTASALLAIIEDRGFEAARNIYSEARQLNQEPFSHMTFNDVGVTLHWMEMIEEEIEWFGYYLETYPKSVEAMYRLARLEALTGNVELGKTKLREAKSRLHLDPDLTLERRLYLETRIDYFLEN